MTIAPARNTGLVPQQKAQLPAVAKETTQELETATRMASAAFFAATGENSITAAIDLAQGIDELRRLFSRPEIKARIQSLQDTALGFRTDRDPNIINRKTNQPNKPYDYEIVKDAVIEALLRGLQLVGNQFNIIAGRFYCTKEGFESLIRLQSEVTNFKLSIGVPQSKNGGVVVACSATWKQNGESSDLQAEIPVKATDSSTADQLIGKATRKFLSRCYQQMTGNSVPDGESDHEVSTPATVSVINGASLPFTQPTAPAIAPAASAPVATLTTEQQEQILTAIERQLSDIGQAAFLQDVANCFGVVELPQIPAEQFSNIMAGLANAGSRERWNRGCASATGDLILSEKEIAALQPPAEEAPTDATEEAPAPALTPTRQARTVVRKAAPAPAAPAEPEGENSSDDALQAQLV